MYLICVGFFTPSRSSSFPNSFSPFFIVNGEQRQGSRRTGGQRRQNDGRGNRPRPWQQVGWVWHHCATPWQQQRLLPSSLPTARGCASPPAVVPSSDEGGQVVVMMTGPSIISFFLSSSLVVVRLILLNMVCGYIVGYMELLLFDGCMW